jgi:phosphatidylinositol glycan class V
VAQGKVLLKTSVKSRYLASLFFALATGTRSNGTFLYIFQLAVSASRFFTSKSKFQLLQEFFTLLTTGLIHASPLFSVLIYGYMTYCYPESLSSSSPYCSSFFPNIYNFVQERYWNVGLFKYWELKQVPNFLLAFPMILLSFQGIRSYIRSNLVSFISLGSFHSGQKPGHHYLNVLVSPFILYWLANLIVLVFIANVQIITRALCSLPVLYWFICRKSAKDNLFVLGFFAGYFWVGIALFSNFYPWT